MPVCQLGGLHALSALQGLFHSAGVTPSSSSGSCGSRAPAAVHRQQQPCVCGSGWSQTPPQLQLLQQQGQQHAAASHQRHVVCHSSSSRGAVGSSTCAISSIIQQQPHSHLLGRGSVSRGRHSQLLPLVQQRSYTDAAPAPIAAAAAAQDQHWPEADAAPQQQQQQAGVATAVVDQQQQQETPPPQQQQQQQQHPALQPHQYSPLHYDIQKFVRRIVPTDQETAEKQRIIQCIAVATKRSFDDTSGIRLQPFGSFVNGLSTWNSDVDLVVTGLVQPDPLTGGFEPADKRLVFTALERIATQLRRYRKVPIKKMIIIRTARIPIIKLETSTRVTADISLGDGSGPKAARYIAQQVAQYPPLAPLTLVVKVFLRSCGLNEVANGGLSSFSITNMVLAHIMQEMQEGRDVYDLGEALYGFLLRFGEEFDISRDAVSVASGGCVSRSDLTHLTDGSLRERLLLEDPLTGRDVATGSYRITAVQAAFRRAARRLEQLASTHHNGSSNSGSARGGGGGRDSGRDSDSGRVNYLEGLFNVQRVLSREGGGGKWSYKGGRGGRGGWGLADGGGVVAEEYYVLGRGGGYTDFDEFSSGYLTDSQVEIPIEGDDYDDELEELLYSDSNDNGSGNSRGRRGRRRQRQ